MLTDLLISKNSKNIQIIKPLLRGRDIHKNSFRYEDKWIILAKYGSHEYLEQEYPDIYDFLLTYYESLKKRGQCTNKGGNGQHHWLELDNNPSNDYLNNFELNKIIYPEFSSSPSFYYDTNKFYLVDTAWVILGGHKYMSAMLNSNVVWFYLSNIVAQLGSKAFRMKKTYLNLLPIPKISDIKQKPFEILVDYILFAKEQDMNKEASLFESIIDGMVYDLYFEEDMKKADCFISDAVTKVIEEFDASSDMIQNMYKVFKENKTIQRGLIYRRVVDVVKVINGEDV